MAERHLSSPRAEGADAGQSHDRGFVPIGPNQPGQLLSSVAKAETHRRRDRRTGSPPTFGVETPLLRLPPNHKTAKTGRLGDQPQAGAPADARGQSAEPETPKVCPDHREYA